MSEKEIRLTVKEIIWLQYVLLKYYFSDPEIRRALRLLNSKIKD